MLLSIPLSGWFPDLPKGEGTRDVRGVSQTVDKLGHQDRLQLDGQVHTLAPLVPSG